MLLTVRIFDDLNAECYGTAADQKSSLEDRRTDSDGSGSPKSAQTAQRDRARGESVVPGVRHCDVSSAECAKSAVGVGRLTPKARIAVDFSLRSFDATASASIY